MSGEMQTIKSDEVAVTKPQALTALPPIQLAGLGNIMQGAKRAFAAARDSYVTMGTEAAALKQDADDVTEQLRKHRTDLRFEAQVGRNSTGDKDS